MTSISRNNSNGFTMLEIMMVVMIIALLAVIAIPAFQRARNKTQVVNTANDIKVFAHAFDLYAMERGGYPPECHMPDDWYLPNEEMESYLNRAKWKAMTPIGGNYNWEGPDVLSYAGISIFGSSALLTTFRALDDVLDDGDLVTGLFRQMPNGRFTYLLDE